MNIIEKICNAIEKEEFNNLPLIDDMTDEEIEDLYEFSVEGNGIIERNGVHMSIEPSDCECDPENDKRGYYIDNEYSICSNCGKIERLK